MKDVEKIARMAALQVLSSVRSQISDVVRDELPTLTPKAAEEVVVNHSRRLFVETPPPPPAANYTIAILQSVKWRSGRGECLGNVWMDHPDGRYIMVEQYRDDCSVLVGDPNRIKPKFEAWKVEEPGTSPWKEFHVMLGKLEEVVLKLAGQGWKPRVKPVQAAFELTMEEVS